MALNFTAKFDYGQMADAGAKAGAMLNKLGNDWKQLKAEDKAAKALYDAMQPADADPQTGAVAAHPLGMGKDQFNSLSAKDRVATMAGLVKAMSIQSVLAEARQKADKTAMLARELKLREALGQRQQTEMEDARQADAALASAMSQTRGAGAPIQTIPAMPGVAEATIPGFPARTLQEAVRGNPRAVLSQNYPNAVRAALMEQEQNQAAEAPFEPTGMVVNAGGFQIPGVKTSKGQFQPAMELATDASGKTNPRYARELGGLTARDRLIGAQKTIDRISRIPESRRNAEDKLDLEEARGIVRELQSGGSAGGGGGDDLWQQFLNGKK